MKPPAANDQICHWYVIPPPKEAVGTLKVNGVAVLPEAGETVAAPEVGVPVHGKTPWPFNNSVIGVAIPPPVIFNT